MRRALPRAKVIFECGAQRVVVTPPLPGRDDCHRVAKPQSRSDHIRHCGRVPETADDDLGTRLVEDRGDRGSVR
ncbi:hypothetical protein [Rhodococcus sp. NPDC058521]|uniref:hypothetical protein n=1 Tax=Rhodococcus sp. NPDC058521 TaxID=3346536 RepID=UPI0036477B32